MRKKAFLVARVSMKGDILTSHRRNCSWNQCGEGDIGTERGRHKPPSNPFQPAGERVRLRMQSIHSLLKRLQMSSENFTRFTRGAFVHKKVRASESPIQQNRGTSSLKLERTVPVLLSLSMSLFAPGIARRCNNAVARPNNQSYFGLRIGTSSLHGLFS